MGVETLERRYLQSAELEVRKGKNSAGKQLVGYAVRYDAMSEDMGFRERISRGAFRESIRDGADVRALVDHDPGKIIGRSTACTLQLTDDEHGVRVIIDPPNTQVGNDLITSVERGDLTGMSFGFRALDDKWETVNGEPVRTVRKAELLDVSIVAFPSYPDTSIAVRSMSRWKLENETMSATATKETTDVKPPETQTIPKPETTEAPPPERRSMAAAPATRTSDPAEWRDVRTGHEVRVLKPNEKFGDLHQSAEPLSMGKAIRALITGTWSGAEAEQRALSTSSNPAAGILVPNPMAASVIDKARARMVLARAGARTIDMPSGTLKIARVATDATMQVHRENVALTASDVTFDGVELTAYTIGTLVKMSRELAADAPNAVSLIEDNIATALAVKIDYYGLRGSGSNEPLGLLNFSGTNGVSVGGAVDWDDLLDGLKECEVDNHVPNAWIVSPAQANNLRKLKVNSEANHYAVAPAAVQALTALTTSAMPDTTIALGQFDRFLIGLRQSPVIEVSTEAGNAFEEHAVYIKVTWRGAFNAEHNDAFALLTGIS